MTDAAVYEKVVSAHGEAKHVSTVFPILTRITKDSDDGAVVSARFAADDGGAWILKLSSSNWPHVDMLYCVSDGGLPDGFIDDLCAVCFEYDLSTPDAVDGALLNLLAKAALLYNKMNNAELLVLAYADAASAGDSSGASSSGSAAVASAEAASRAAQLEKAQATFREAAELERSSYRRRPVHYKSPEFEPTPLATATLTKQLQMLSNTDTLSMGFSVEPVDDSLYQWSVKLFYADMETQLARDLKEHPTHDHVEMEFRFPSGYPCEPPFCRVVGPAFQRGTGYVQSHGAICMELLTGSGWTPANSMDAVAVQIHSFLTAGKGRLDLASPERVKEYTFAGALRDMSAIVNAHAWDVGNARVAKPRKRPRGEGDQ
jgi:ubiquitin-protein ligase